jgi:hypothetical protein
MYGPAGRFPAGGTGGFTTGAGAKADGAAAGEKMGMGAMDGTALGGASGGETGGRTATGAFVGGASGGDTGGRMITGAFVATGVARGIASGLGPATGEGPIGVTGLFVGVRTATGAGMGAIGAVALHLRHFQPTLTGAVPKHRCSQRVPFIRCMG